jgi:MscS family membrane protein
VHRSLVVSLITLAITLWSPLSQAAVPSCGNPRGAADTPFYWQTPPSANLTRAAACFEAKGRTPKQLRQMARRLRAVYNNVGAIVPVATLPDKANYVDGSGLARITPHEAFRDVVIVRVGSRWLWTKSSLDSLDAHYAKIAGFERLIARIPAAFKSTLFDIAYWQFLALLLLALFGLGVRRMLQAVIASRVRSLGEKFGQRWATKIVDVIDAPGATLVTAIILRIGYPRLQLPLYVASAMSTVVQVLITISLFWAAYRAVELVGAKLAERAEQTDSKLDDQLVPLVRKSLKKWWCSFSARSSPCRTSVSMSRPWWPA